MKHIYILLVFAIFSLNSTYAQKSNKKAAMTASNLISLNSKELKVYPNPSSNFIQVKGLKDAKIYEMYNFYGVIVSKGSVSSDDKIDVQHLKAGVYYLVFERKSKLIFVKE